MLIVESDREQRGHRSASIERRRYLQTADPVSAMRWLGPGWLRPPFRTPGFLFLRPSGWTSCMDPCLPRLLLDRLSGAQPAWPLDGVIGPQDGKASIALPQWRWRDFLPLGCAHSSRAKKVSPPPSSAALRPQGVRR